MRSCMTPIFSEIWTFARRHWLHVLLCLPGVFGVTLIHESAHAVAAISQGAVLEQFVWLPSGGHWGYVSYLFPAHHPHSPELIGLAPYLLWASLAALVAMLSFRVKPWSFRVASFLYFWLFFVPLADIGNTAIPYLWGRDNDFSQVWGSPTEWSFILVALATLLALWVGYGMQRRLYRSAALSPVAYGLVSIACVAALGLMT